jgi:hypothetical protein
MRGEWSRRVRYFPDSVGGEFSLFISLSASAFSRYRPRMRITPQIDKSECRGLRSSLGKFSHHSFGGARSKAPAKSRGHLPPSPLTNPSCEDDFPLLKRPLYTATVLNHLPEFVLRTSKDRTLTLSHNPGARIYKRCHWLLHCSVNGAVPCSEDPGTRSWHARRNA